MAASDKLGTPIAALRRDHDETGVTGVGMAKLKDPLRRCRTWMSHSLVWRRDDPWIDALRRDRRLSAIPSRTVRFRRRGHRGLRGGLHRCILRRRRRDHRVEALIGAGRGLPFDPGTGKTMENRALIPATEKRSWIKLSEEALPAPARRHARRRRRPRSVQRKHEASAVAPRSSCSRAATPRSRRPTATRPCRPISMPCLTGSGTSGASSTR